MLTQSWSERFFHSFNDYRNATMQSSHFTPDPLPMKMAQHRSAAVESLYPSRLEIEAIEIPDCREVFLPKSSMTCRSQKSSGPTRAGSIHNSSQPIRSPSGHRLLPPSCQDQLVYYQAKAFARKESDASYGSSQPGMVNVMGPPHIPFDRKPSIQKDPTSRLELEVSPGIFLPLHGSQETLSAMQQGQLVSCACFVCTLTIMCVPQASYVLCPDCRVVSPVERSAVPMSMKYGTALSGEVGGVGLGMKMEEYRSPSTYH
jgi:hypothetical protein